MKRTIAQSINARAANSLVEQLQCYFVEQLNQSVGSSSFEPVEWFRDQGLHGGGIRYVATSENFFNRASVNVSQIHYDDIASKNLASATAISTIIHPKNPFTPSVHMHISWTEMKNGKGYWRMMADLNPAIENPEATDLFTQALKKVAPQQYQLAAEQGDRYFNIPVLERHRGVSHFYLEEYFTENAQVDFDLAKAFGEAVIDCYVAIFSQENKAHPTPEKQDFEKQRAYHTLYLFQVLTLDRGTTSGLLVHDQNDLGIMGSLPAFIDKSLLKSWVGRLVAPQDELLKKIVNALSDKRPCVVTENEKLALAKVLRQHYKLYPKALSLQAHGNSIPTTVGNHCSEDK